MARKIVFFALLIAVIISAIIVDVEKLSETVRAYAADDETMRPAMALAALFTLIAALLPLPAEAPAVLNGVLFTPLVAFLLTYVFAYLGAAIAYECGRLLGYETAAQMIGYERMHRVEKLINRAGWPTLLALRLSPVMAFTALNWASGVLKLSRPVFYWTMLVGLLPGTYVFTIIPHILDGGRGLWLYVGIIAAIMIGLFAITVLRFRNKA
ncbi:MAG: VTT domain-containing protein [Sphingomonadales bacterium]|jgi:uncharacterized membrane protein YdjX (TVP38/TMEM64 family)